MSAIGTFLVSFFLLTKRSVCFIYPFIIGLGFLVCSYHNDLLDLVRFEAPHESRFIRLGNFSVEKKKSSIFKIHPYATKFFIAISAAAAIQFVLVLLSPLSYEILFLGIVFSGLVFSLIVLTTSTIVVRFAMFFSSAIGTQKLNKDQRKYVLKVRID